MKRALLVLVMLVLPACGPSAEQCAASTDTYANYGQAALESTCRSCHEHTNQFSTQAAVHASLAKMISEVASGSMPEETTMSSTDRERLLLWLGCGAL